MTRPAPARAILLPGLVAVLAGIALLVSLDLDISPHRYLRNGELPLWDRKQGGGYSVVAQGNLGVMFPPRWLTAPLPPHQARSAFMLLTLYLCFAGHCSGSWRSGRPASLPHSEPGSTPFPA